MLKPLRQAAQEQLSAVPASRRPALRRCNDAGALLATDLPLIATRDAVQALTGRMEQLGWRWRLVRGWLLLDADIPVPPWRVPDHLHGECGCCISLLLRHPGADAPAEPLRELAKAAEAGQLERYCMQLHAAMAASLRRGEALPGGLLPYLCYAYCQGRQNQ